MARFAAYFEQSRSLPHASPPRSPKWQLLAAEELARPGLMQLRAVRSGDRTVDFIWDGVDVRAARTLEHFVFELVGQRLLEVLGRQCGHRSIFEHYRRVFESGVAEAALQLQVGLGSEDIVRHAVVARDGGVAVTLLNLSAARRVQALHAASGAVPAPRGWRWPSQPASATVGPDSSKPTTTRA